MDAKTRSKLTKEVSRILRSKHLGTVEGKTITYYNPFAVLRLDCSAVEVEIKKQYYEISRLVHPDKNPDENAGEAFSILSGAYALLLDSKYGKMFQKVESEVRETIETQILRGRTKNVNEKRKQDWIEEALEERLLQIFWKMELNKNNKKNSPQPEEPPKVIILQEYYTECSKNVENQPNQPDSSPNTPQTQIESPKPDLSSNPPQIQSEPTTPDSSHNHQTQKTEPTTPDSSHNLQTQPEPPKPDLSHNLQTQPELPKPDSSHNLQTQPELPKPDSSHNLQTQPELPKPDPSYNLQTLPELPKPDPSYNPPFQNPSSPDIPINPKREGGDLVVVPLGGQAIILMEGAQAQNQTIINNIASHGAEHTKNKMSHKKDRHEKGKAQRHKQKGAAEKRLRDKNFTFNGKVHFKRDNE